MSLATKDFIKTIIDSGADASMNLFTITFRPLGLKEKNTEVENTFSCRITNIANLLQRNNTSVDIPYQNVTIPKLSSGSDLPKKLSFTIRLDDTYYILDTLRQLQSIDNFGNIVEDESKKLKIIISAYKPATSGGKYSSVNSAIIIENFYSQYTWTFNECYITNISPLTYGYENASVGTMTVGFIWKSYEESREDEQNNRENVQSIQEETQNLNTEQYKESSTTSSQSLIDLNVKKLRTDLSQDYNTSSITQNYNTDSNSSFLEKVNDINTTTRSSETNTSTLTTVKIVTQNSELNSLSNETDSNRSSVNSFINQKLLSNYPTSISSPKKDIFNAKYLDTDSNSAKTYINSIQKAENTRTSSKLTSDGTISTVLDNANIKTKTIQLYEATRRSQLQ